MMVPNKPSNLKPKNRAILDDLSTGLHFVTSHKKRPVQVKQCFNSLNPTAKPPAKKCCPVLRFFYYCTNVSSDLRSILKSLNSGTLLLTISLVHCAIPVKPLVPLLIRICQ